LRACRVYTKMGGLIVQAAGAHVQQAMTNSQGGKPQARSKRQASTLAVGSAFSLMPWAVPLMIWAALSAWGFACLATCEAFHHEYTHSVRAAKVFWVLTEIIHCLWADDRWYSTHVCAPVQMHLTAVQMHLTAVHTCTLQHFQDWHKT